MKSHYKAPRVVLAGAGGVDHEKLCSLADKYLGGLSSSYEDSPIGVPDVPPALFTGSEVAFSYIQPMISYPVIRRLTIYQINLIDPCA